jgi:hypothetical protein
MAAKKPAPSKAVTNYDEELAKLAGKSATLTNSGGGGRFFSTSAGQLKFDDVPLPGNQMVVVIGAWCLENVYYDSDYDADNRTPPACFAFCKDPDAKDEMGPPALLDNNDDFDKQSDDCESCPQNQWGSAAKGRGKACSNRRRLACLPAGTYTSAGKNGGYDLELVEDADHFRTCEEAYLKVPVMSGKGFDAYVRDVADQFSKPLFAVYTRVYLTPDSKSQFRVNFELIEPVADELIPALFERYKKLDEGIDFPYVVFEEEEAAPKAKAAASKKLTRGKAPARKR